MTLKKRTIKGLKWSSVDSIGNRVFTLFFTVMLARLLEPRDFGLLALLTVFINVAETIMRGGFVQALIRKKTVSETDYSTIFSFNLTSSLLFYTILYLSSPLIADFFGEPGLGPIIKTISLVIILHSFGVVPYVSLKRNLNFKLIAIVRLVAIIVGGMVALYLALNGMGVWSLVAKTLLTALASSVLFWLFAKPKPRLSFSMDTFKEHFSFGYKITLASFISKLAKESYSIIIGRLYSIEVLGFFHQGKKFSSLVSTTISNVFNNVSYPVMASVQDNSGQLKKAYLRFFRVSAFVSFPLMMLLVVVAQPLFIIILTEKWLDAVVFFQILCVGEMFSSLIVISGLSTLVKNRPGIYLRLEVFFKGLLLFVLLVSSFAGVEAMAVGIVSVRILQFSVNLFVAKRLYKVPALEQLSSILPIFFASLFAAVVSYLFSLAISSLFVLLIVQGSTFVVSYLLVLYFAKNEELKEVFGLMVKKWKNRV